MSGSISKPKILSPGFVQRPVLTPLLFNLYVTDLPTIISRIFMYADDITFASKHTNITVLKRTLSRDPKLLVKYFWKWQVTPSVITTETTVFHLSNRLSSTLLQVVLKSAMLPYNFQFYKLAERTWGLMHRHFVYSTVECVGLAKQLAVRKRGRGAKPDEENNFRYY